MVEMKGIHLCATEEQELHEVASKFLVSKSYFSSTPYPHYEVINGLKHEEITRWIEKSKRK